MGDMQEGALTNRNDAYNLLRQLGAPERLLRHAQLVGEAADSLIEVYRELGVEFDASVIELLPSTMPEKLCIPRSYPARAPVTSQRDKRWCSSIASSPRWRNAASAMRLGTVRASLSRSGRSRWPISFGRASATRTSSWSLSTRRPSGWALAAGTSSLAST